MRSKAWFHYDWDIAVPMVLFIGAGRQRRQPEGVAAPAQ